MSTLTKRMRKLRLAAAIAKETGETLTQVVMEALRERLERLQTRRPKATMEELRSIVERAIAGRKHSYVDHAEFLYAEQGLPK